MAASISVPLTPEMTPSAKRVKDGKSPAIVKEEKGTSSEQRKRGSLPRKNSDKLKQQSLLSFFSKVESPLSSEGKQKPAETKNRIDEKLQNEKTEKANIKEEKATHSPRNDGVLADNAMDVKCEPNSDAPTEPTEPTDPFILPSDDLEAMQNSSPSTGRRGRRKFNYAESSDEESISPKESANKKQKRRRVIESDDEEFEPDNSDSQEEEEMAELSVSEVAEDLDLDDESSTPKSVSKVTPKKRGKSKSITPEKVKYETNSLSSFASSSSASNSTTAVKRESLKRKLPTTQFEQQNADRYQWLLNVRDAKGVPIGDPEYDPRTLYIPPDAWKKFTPFEKQYWEVKSKMFDTVVFFKKGKFYELYENDAEIAHNQFDLKLAGGGRANMRLAGVPEMSFDFWAASFIAKGYKVAKVDQMESALAKEMRENGTPTSKSKEEKVVRRELQCILTAGTLTDAGMLGDDMSTYCMAVKEEVTPLGNVRFGVAFVDTATGEFHISVIDDDQERFRFETLVAQIRPRELVVEKGNLSARATKIIRMNTSVQTLWNHLIPVFEFWDGERSKEELKDGTYFADGKVPDFVQYMVSNDDMTVGLTALGGLVSYLRTLKLDKSLVSLGNIKAYDPIRPMKTLILDGQSLQNLEIFVNSDDGTDAGTLFRLLNRCITPFGKRLLKQWTSHPLSDFDELIDRQNAVEFFINSPSLLSKVESGLSSLPDMERMLARVHSGRISVKDFLHLIVGLERSETLMQSLSSCDDPLIQRIIKDVPIEFSDQLSVWSVAFDRQEAATGHLVPEPGVEPALDAARNAITEIEKQLRKELNGYRKELRCQDMVYRDSGKEIYLIEVPTRVKVPSSWQQMGATSKVKRFWSPEVRKLARELLEARERLKSEADLVEAKMFTRFGSLYTLWMKTVKAVAQIDCICSLAKTSTSLGHPAVRPSFVRPDDQSHRAELRFKELRHPCFNAGTRKTDFIPNDIHLGGNAARMNLLTGANAAGKSTVLRMTCVAVILAQLGCYVPCEEAVLTPMDAVMTRLGASDNLFAGRSTFMVELTETKKLMSTATPRTLVVLDELGRGGSSSDGFAIAEAVLHHLSTHVQTLGFFATHYATLWSSFSSHPEVAPKRMAILVDEEQQRLTFLYKLEDGVAPGSFGMHVARMCGVDDAIVNNAREAAESLEHTSRIKKVWEMTSKEEKGLNLGLQSDASWLLQKERTRTLDHFFDQGTEISSGTTELKNKAMIKCVLQIIENMK